MGNAGQVNYSSGKAGVIGLTKTLAKDGASSRSTCNAVAFGFVETRLTQAKEKGEQLSRRAAAGGRARHPRADAPDGDHVIPLGRARSRRRRPGPSCSSLAARRTTCMARSSTSPAVSWAGCTPSRRGEPRSMLQTRFTALVGGPRAAPAGRHGTRAAESSAAVTRPGALGMLGGADQPAALLVAEVEGARNDGPGPAWRQLPDAVPRPQAVQAAATPTATRTRDSCGPSVRGGARLRPGRSAQAEEARAAEAPGCEFVIAQGVEAGGPRARHHRLAAPAPRRGSRRGRRARLLRAASAPSAGWRRHSPCRRRRGPGRHALPRRRGGSVHPSHAVERGPSGPRGSAAHADVLGDGGPTLRQPPCRARASPRWRRLMMRSWARSSTPANANPSLAWRRPRRACGDGARGRDGPLCGWSWNQSSRPAPSGAGGARRRRRAR